MSTQIYWQKSSYSGGGDGNSCVEVGWFDDGIAIRESDDPGMVIHTSRAKLGALMARVCLANLPGTLV
ncbi:DUF397 domain-containing protein [Streptomyces sp. AV19]|uniref:DUF397 domain-containing protein n=1 Tax=Streptomyces sp. AV19 TaxID=2793068 RepID=UPI0018FEE678|nr:DUF397 domain-containing protein [Streptomyces sp. AV19]MBH1934545.1 DUF397 domain-containing protein [Streptomyces sp. AV19]MDG4530908.1 DUF397 domain-containing protein [Streptomyces sp. AV19]